MSDPTRSTASGRGSDRSGPHGSDAEQSQLSPVDSEPEPFPTVTSLFIAPASRLAMKTVESVTAHTGGGLVGDRYEASRHRHVSVMSVGELAEASERLGRRIDPALTRRNVLVDAGLLSRTPGSRLSLGPVELEVVRDAAPCRLLDDQLGEGAKTAMRRRAGVICRVLVGGEISIGDPCQLPPRSGDLVSVNPVDPEARRRAARCHR